MHWAKFLGYNALGAVLWVCTWAGVGYLAGENIVEIYAAFERYKWYVIAAILVIVAVAITRRVRRGRAPAGA
jgi:membrane protein DedA with SNARE-associated domain